MGRLPTEEEATWIDLYKKGLRAGPIADRCGVSRATVVRALKRAGIYVPTAPSEVMRLALAARKRPAHPEWIAMRRAGATMREIAEAHGVTPQAVSWWLRRHDTEEVEG